MLFGILWTAFITFCPFPSGRFWGSGFLLAVKKKFRENQDGENIASRIINVKIAKMAAVQPLFGIVIPGRPVITEFQLLGSTKAITMVDQPSTVSEITFFLLPTTPIPAGFGAILYYSLPPFQSWELLGSVDPSKPSGVFRTGWSTHDEMKNCNVVQLGVSLEP